MPKYEVNQSISLSLLISVNICVNMQARYSKYTVMFMYKSCMSQSIYDKCTRFPSLCTQAKVAHVNLV